MTGDRVPESGSSRGRSCTQSAWMRPSETAARRQSLRPWRYFAPQRAPVMTWGGRKRDSVSIRLTAPRGDWTLALPSKRPSSCVGRKGKRLGSAGKLQYRGAIALNRGNAITALRGDRTRKGKGPESNDTKTAFAQHRVVRAGGENTRSGQKLRYRDAIGWNRHLDLRGDARTKLRYNELEYGKHIRP